MRSTEVNKILAEFPQLKDGDYFLLTMKGFVLLSRIRISHRVENHLRKYQDCDFMVLSKEDLEGIAWR